MYTGRVGKALFRAGWYRNSVEGPARIGVTRNWFGHGKVLPGAVWGGGINVGAEQKQLAFLADSASNPAARQRILEGIRDGKVTFDHADRETEVKPVLEGLKADAALGALAAAAYEKLFPRLEEQPKPPVFETIEIGDRSTLKIRPHSADVVSGKLLSVELAEEQTVYGRVFPEGTMVFFRHDSSDETCGVKNVLLGKPAAMVIGTSEVREGTEIWFEENTGTIQWIRLAHEQEINGQLDDGGLKATIPAGAWLYPRMDHQLVEIKMLELPPHGAITGGKEGLEELGWAVGRSEKENNPRRIVNEDGFLLVRGEYRDLLIVADGMGGHAKGEEASMRAIQAVYSALALRETNLTISRAIEFAAIVVDEDKDAAGESIGHGRGTTIVVAEIHEDRLNLAHVGDSRCYVVKPDGQVALLTFDHSLVVDVLKHNQPTLSAPLSGSDLAQFERDILNPNKVPLNLASTITRALGRDKSQADVSDISLEAGDWTLLCTDGLTGAIPQLSELLAQLRKDGKTPEEAVAILFEEARRLKPDKRDNITVVIREHGREVTLTARIDAVVAKDDTAGIIDLCTQIALGQLKPIDEDEAIRVSGTLGRLAMRGKFAKNEELQGSAEAAQAFLLAPDEETV